MNREALGALGELVGALAVVATLVYLAGQIRQSNRVGVTASEANFRSMAQSVNRSVVEFTDDDPFLMELLKEEPDYSPTQYVKALCFARSCVNLWMFADSSYRNELIDKVTYQNTIDDIGVVLREYPGLRVPFAYFQEEYQTHKYEEDSIVWREINRLMSEGEG